MENLPRLIVLVLMFGLAPVWLAAGLADYACHRAAGIERNAGVKESALHLLMLAELGVGLLAALFLELTAGALALILAACIAHEITVCADLAYAESKRTIPWYEQVVHALQQSLPWVGLLLLMLLHAPQALALLGLGTAPAQWSLTPKVVPLPTGYVALFLLAASLTAWAPFLEEFGRCLRAVRREAVSRASEAPIANGSEDFIERGP